MTQEEKELLLKDLSARLPYEVMVSVQGNEFNSYKYPYRLTAISKFGLDSLCKVYHPIYTPFGAPNVEDIKPYLRPMSSMTDEEKKELSNIRPYFVDENGIIVGVQCNSFVQTTNCQDWLNAHHFDYRGLIEKGLAVEVTKDNNPYKE